MPIKYDCTAYSVIPKYVPAVPLPSICKTLPLLDLADCITCDISADVVPKVQPPATVASAILAVAVDVGLIFNTVEPSSNPIKYD